MTIEDDLGRLHSALRKTRPKFGGAEIAEGLRAINPLTGESALIGMRRNEWDLGREAREALVNDLRFEYLPKPEVQVSEFVADCVFRPGDVSINDFVTAYAREPETRICYLPIESLKVAAPLEILSLTFLPTDDESLPPADLLFDLRSPVGSVARVTLVGTNPMLMAKRAREEVTRVLRVMRIAFRAERAIREQQLRFRLGTSYAFDAGEMSGVHTREDIVWGLEANQNLADLAARQFIASASPKPVTDIQCRVDVAIRWMERATFEPDRLLGILFLFFALESLLGDKSGELKAGALSMRQMMLSHIVDGHFTNPITTFDFYKVTRSGAVHGETISKVEDAEYEAFSDVTLRTLEQYLEIANREGFSKRRQIRKFIDEHGDQALLINWVRTRGSMPEFEKQFRDLVNYVDSMKTPRLNQ